MKSLKLEEVGTKEKSDIVHTRQVAQGGYVGGLDVSAVGHSGRQNRPLGGFLVRTAAEHHQHRAAVGG